jgi:DNA-binding GntR family transcriptional regulator
MQDLVERPPLRPLGAFGGSLSQRVYASLKEAILNLSLRPGAIVRKGRVCEALGVSRSPVSEAVARLAAEALVEVVRQAGTFVAKLSMEEVREGAFMREALELAAIEDVAQTAIDERLVLLRRTLRLQEGLIVDGDLPAFHDADA